jgi:CO/xanthine dehydrogenase FAD-binding subunit
VLQNSDEIKKQNKSKTIRIALGVLAHNKPWRDFEVEQFL